MALARILGIADRLLDESKDWLWLGGRMPDFGDRVSANEAFLDRYEARLPELLEPDDAEGQVAEATEEPIEPAEPVEPVEPVATLGPGA